MSFDPHDDDLSGFGLRRRVLDEASVDASAGYSIPGVPFAVAPYKSLAVFAALGGGGTFTAKVTWDWDGAAGGATASETKTSTSVDGETLLFHNQGSQVTEVVITGDATTAYAVALSEADPLADAAASSASPVYPFHQVMNLSAIFDFGDNGGGTAMVLDALVRSNHYIQTTNQNGYITFLFLAGPQYARHEVLWTHLHGPDRAIVSPRMARLSADENPNLGFVNPLELIADWTANAPTWVNLTAYNHDCYAAALSRNHTSGIHFRVQGAEGAPFTAVSTDADGYYSVDGGPGIYVMQLRALTKNATSTGYKMGISELSVHRIDGFGFL